MMILCAESRRTKKKCQWLNFPFVSLAGGGEARHPHQPGGDAHLPLPLLRGGGGHLHYLGEGSVSFCCDEAVASGLLTSIYDIK